MRLLSLTQPLYTRDLPWRRILVPVDFSVTSLRTLKVAAALARLVGARLLLLHVIEPNPYPTGLEGAILVIPDAELTRKARKQLPQVARRFIPESVRVSSFVARGRAANTIVSMAERKRADLIMLGTHDPKGMQRLFLGGTTAQVVRQATCPVFAVRRQPLPKRAGGGGRNRD
jgi:nucleotide-binding universal stress UspA family protein